MFAEYVNSIRKKKKNSKQLINTSLPPGLAKIGYSLKRIQSRFDDIKRTIFNETEIFIDFKWLKRKENKEKQTTGTSNGSVLYTEKRKKQRN